MRRAAAIAATLILASGCAAAPSRASADIVVFAAASLSDAFAELGRHYMQRNPGTTVTFQFAGSQQLARQLRDGAPADVFAPASADDMEAVAAAGVVAAAPTVFAHNRLAIAVEAGNPMAVGGLADLAAARLKVALPDAAVPAGRYARWALANAGVEVAPVSLERDVRAVLAKVALGEVDAGIVYQSDLVAAADDVDGIDIPAEHNVVAAYPIAAVTPRGAPFVELVLSEEGAAILASYGLGRP